LNDFFANLQMGGNQNQAQNANPPAEEDQVMLNSFFGSMAPAQNQN
jgi:hypothetical protein